MDLLNFPRAEQTGALTVLSICLEIMLYPLVPVCTPQIGRRYITIYVKYQVFAGSTLYNGDGGM